MITLRQIALEIIELESGGPRNDDSNLSLPYVVQYVRQFSNTVLAPRVFEKLAVDDRSLLQLMIASYIVTVQGTGSTKYITLPEFYMSLPFNKGLAAVAPVDDPTNHFIPRNSPAVSKDLPCADLDPGQFSYWTKGMNVYFDNDLEFGKVLVDLVIASPDSIGLDDPLPIYPEHQSQIIRMVRSELKSMPLQDRRLDGSPDIGTKLQSK
jgi:hypothetical protein